MTACLDFAFICSHLRALQGGHSLTNVVRRVLSSLHSYRLRIDVCAVLHVIGKFFGTCRCTFCEHGSHFMQEALEAHTWNKNAAANWLLQGGSNVPQGPALRRSTTDRSSYPSSIGSGRSSLLAAFYICPSSVCVLPKCCLRKCCALMQICYACMHNFGCFCKYGFACVHSISCFCNIDKGSIMSIDIHSTEQA